MPTLTWSSALALSHPQMDATHQEFVDLLTAAENALVASHEAGLAAYEALVVHTIGHFGQEDRWMQATGYAADNCHTGQHQQVLMLMQEVTRLAREENDWGPLERVLPELGKWFEMHAQTMDAMLASHLEQVGYDPDSGFVGHPLNTSQPVSGCGGSGHSCGSEPAGHTAETAAA
ncbi:hemerythrin [Ideonella sp. TBM-1]|uniref:Hemerythrin n=2 Tax=Ideonella livida TaxID=2707176 RepID=A0A7C9TIV0_9BURK|nr:hemerythrin [Ideonella livida]